MNAEFEELTLKLNQANAKIDALQTIVALLLGWEGKSNPLVLTSLRMLAAGDVPELMPDLSTIPSNFTPAQRAHVEADLAKHRKATKVAIMELATTYSLLLGEAKRGYPQLYFARTMCVARSVATCSTVRYPKARRSRPVKSASPWPSATGARARWISSTWPA